MVKKTASITAISLFLAGASGFLVSTAIGQDSASSADTVTITISNGATGPAGPEGPVGPVGPKGDTGPPGPAQQCDPGYSYTVVVFNHPGGQLTTKICVLD